MIRKRFLATKCQVTFELPQTLAQNTRCAYLVGDFNGWNMHAMPMQPGEGNRFSITLELDLDHEYQFRYFINDRDWRNDTGADKYVPNPYHDHNSVVSTCVTHHFPDVA